MPARVAHEEPAVGGQEEEADPFPYMLGRHQLGAGLRSSIKVKNTFIEVCDDEDDDMDELPMINTKSCPVVQMQTFSRPKRLEQLLESQWSGDLDEAEQDPAMVEVQRLDSFESVEGFEGVEAQSRDLLREDSEELSRPVDRLLALCRSQLPEAGPRSVPLQHGEQVGPRSVPFPQEQQAAPRRSVPFQREQQVVPRSVPLRPGQQDVPRSVPSQPGPQALPQAQQLSAQPAQLHAPVSLRQGASAPPMLGSSAPSPAYVVMGPALIPMQQVLASSPQRAGGTVNSPTSTRQQVQFVVPPGWAPQAPASGSPQQLPLTLPGATGSAPSAALLARSGAPLATAPTTPKAAVSQRPPSPTLAPQGGCGGMNPPKPVDVIVPLERREPQPSAGAREHAIRECRPCAWFWKAQGCANGRDCRHCHMCPEGELKSRRKSKTLVLRSKAHTLGGEDDEGAPVVGVEAMR